MKTARIIDGTVTHYPYALRPTAKQLHPEVSPLPGSWEQCTDEQRAALKQVWVLDVARPVNAREGDPEYVDGQWRQNWIVQPDHDPTTHAVRWDGAQWVVSPLPPRAVPDMVDAHKFKIALRRNGFRATFDTYLTTAGANERDFWNSAPTIKRTSRYLDSLKTALSLTNTQVRNLLIAADDEQD